jgi:hypothetical protein
MKEQQARANDANDSESTLADSGTRADVCPGPAVQADRDFIVLTTGPNQDLVHFVDLLDQVVASDQKLHAALLWPHIPPRAILSWMLREVSRGYISYNVSSVIAALD